MTLGTLYNATIDGEPALVYRSMYDLPKGEVAMTRLRLAPPSNAIIPKESDVKVLEVFERLIVERIRT